MMNYITHSTTVLDLNTTEKFLLEGSAIAERGLPTWLSFSFTLFFGGLLGMVFNYKNFLVTMMSVELMYLGIVTSFILYGAEHHDEHGAIYGLVLLVLAACESAIGLGILIVLHRFGRSIDFEEYQNLRG